MIKQLFLSLGLLVVTHYSTAQIDSSLLRHKDADTVKTKLNMDALYSRPFLKINKVPVALGGYIEMNYQHLGTDGVSNGSELQFRRFSLFVASSVARRIKLMSEIEFENDPDEEAEGKSTEIEIEYAALDVEFHPLLNLRAGMVINPIGAFNQNHDGPKWEFTDRPLAMTQMLPATFSNMGAGLYGKRYHRHWMFGYECYLTGGLDNSIIDNDHNKTFLPEAKENTSRFVTSASGEPLLNGKLALRNTRIGELGISWMGDVYNQWQQDGVIIEHQRRCDVFDLDFNTTITKTKTTLVGEWAWIFVQVPPGYTQQYGTRQRGGYIDVVQPLLKRKMLGWEGAQINLALRAEYIDWNVGTFQATGGNIYDDLWSLMPAISFRPVPQTVLRLNYRYLQQRDIVGNPPSLTGGFILGLSSYF